MKIKIFLVILLGVLFLNIEKIYCQGVSNSGPSMSRVIRIDSLYKCYGVIFDSNYTSPIEIHNIKKRITPSESDVIIAEQIFVAQYNTTNQVSEGRKGAKIITDPKKYFEEFNRQYIGYLDNEDDINLIIHLFDYSKKRRVRKYIGESWKNNFVIILADELPFDIITYRVDITQKQLYATF